MIEPSEQLRLLLKSATAGATAVGEDLEDEGDWQPVLLCVNDTTVTVVGIPGELMRDDRSKTMLAEVVIPAMAQTTEADGLALVTSSWQGTQSPASEDPDRIEALVVIAVTRTQSAFQSATIIRDAGNVQLTWDEPIYSDDEAEVGIDGRFPEALRNALA